ncbi:MAG: hypothetical protein RLY93_20550 [Sumerlaeia bacterium]
MSERKVSLGPKASSFSDKATGFTVLPGEVKPLTTPVGGQTQKALQAGGLVYVDSAAPSASGAKSGGSSSGDAKKPSPGGK